MSTLPGTPLPSHTRALARFFALFRTHTHSPAHHRPRTHTPAHYHPRIPWVVPPRTRLQSVAPWTRGKMTALLSYTQTWRSVPPPGTHKHTSTPVSPLKYKYEHTSTLDETASSSFVSLWLTDGVHFKIRPICSKPPGNSLAVSLVRRDPSGSRQNFPIPQVLVFWRKVEPDPRKDVARQKFTCGWK